MSNNYHTSVLLKDCIDNLNIKPDEVYVDLTFGGGGHSAEILKHLSPNGKLFAFDQDVDALKNKLIDPRFILIPQNFRFLKNYLRLHGITKVNGILGDLGVSSHQFDEASRGFSIRFDANLDMRMNVLQGMTAQKLLETYSEEELRRIFKEYGELSEAGKLAKHLINVRSDRPIKTTRQLMDLIRPFMRRGQEHTFAAQVFQSIRIEVNDELESLKQMLLQTSEILSPGGRLVVMSYHSLEDRLVKNFLRSGKFEGEVEKDLFGNSKLPFKGITRKPIRPDAEEIHRNNRSRSAILRIGEKNEE
jgi:16S rRNA (cytosine1402-N4)-methyltransferase